MKQHLYIILYCLPFFVAHGLPIASDEDSTRTYNTQEMVITATRSTIQSQDSPSPVTILSTEDIQRTNGSSVADVLRSSESLFLKDQGPTASLKTLSFRGMGAEDILVLLDGTRINNFQNGQVDFSLIPMTDIDHIEVVRGGSSALYGADALGGIINIITRRPVDTLQMHADISEGSFDYQRYTFETRGRIDGLGLVFGVMHDQAHDDYPFNLQRIGMADTTERRTNSDFTRTQLYLNSDYSFDEQANMNLSIQRVKSNQGVPGPLPSLYPFRQDDDAITSVVVFHDNHFNGIVFSLNMGLTYDLEMAYSQTKTILETINPQFQWIASSWDRLIIGAEYTEGHLEGFFPDAVIKRLQRSAYVSNEMLFQRESLYLDRFSFYQSIRYDDLSEGTNATSPKIGLNVRILRDWDSRIRVSYGKNFRMPTFNDLYYPAPYGNPLLKPEHSDCYDIGLETAFDHSGMHQLSLTYFTIDTKDRILLNAAYFPENVPQVQSTGIEGRYEFRLPSNILMAFADVTFNNAIQKSSDSTDGKHLVNNPKEVCSFGTSLRMWSLNVNITESYTSERFTAEDESAWLPHYWLMDFNLSTVFALQHIRINLRAEVSNVFNNDYQILEGYPMPG